MLMTGSHPIFAGLVLLSFFVPACVEPPNPEQRAKDPADAAKAETLKEEAAVPAAGQFSMPAWFHEGVVEHVAVIQQQRTPDQPDGSFRAFILFEMPPNEDAGACIERFRAKIAPDVSLGSTTTAEGTGGRLQIFGETDQYSVTVVCGQAKGKNSGFLTLNKKPG